jgi:hypothetical protein
MVNAQKRPRGHTWRVLLQSAWALLSLVPTYVAGTALADSIAHSSYDATENRAPEARIAIAAIATALGLAAVSVAVQRMRGREARLWPASALLSCASVLLIALWALVTLASGRT